MPSMMLPKTASTSGRGQMAVMDRLFSTGSATEPSAEELAYDKAVLRMVQKEIFEADEANLLEEEDMHVFDREPLSDRLSLVSCNYCKKPIKTSQYLAHAEWCRSFSTSDETLLELDGGTGPKKPPRKARKKFFSSQENQSGMLEAERSQSFDGEDATLAELANVPGNVADSQVACAATSGLLRIPKRSTTLSEANVLTTTKAGRLQKTENMPGVEVAGQFEGAGTSFNDGVAGAGVNNAGFSDTSSPSKRSKINADHSFLTPDDLDLICGGVSSDSMTSCQRPLTSKVQSESTNHSNIGQRQPYDVLIRELKNKNTSGTLLDKRGRKQHDTAIPLPIATKVYHFRQQHQMRAVIGYLFHEAVGREDSSAGTSPNSISGDQGCLTLDGVTYDLQQRSQAPPDHNKAVDMGDIGSNLPTPGPSNPQQESRMPFVPTPKDIGQSAVLRSRVMHASQLLAISSPGSSLNTIQQSPLGSVHAT
eukprot:c24167_g1_i1 orf=753-2189(+)